MVIPKNFMSFYPKSVSILVIREWISKDLGILVTNNNELFYNSHPQAAVFKGIC